MPAFCKICNQYSATDTDPITGGVVCLECGFMIEETNIVSEVSFHEHADGSHSVIGQHIPESGSVSIRGMPTSQAESREITIQKAKSRIRFLADQLNISSALVEQALYVYKLALQNNFTKGRKAYHIAAACLYIACRREKTAHMLIDFSEALQTDVFLLGTVFVKLTRKLSLNLPIVEPYLYIPRFAHQLEFGEKYQSVVNTSLKLVSCMKRDWMSTGRRPAGLCAAAIIIAARMHNFKRTNEEVVRVVKICAGTLIKRLREFEQTKVARMSPEEFYAMNEEDVQTEQDPPAFTKNLRKKKEELENAARKLEEEESDYEDDDAIEQEEVRNKAKQQPKETVSEDAVKQLEQAAKDVEEFEKEFEKVEQEIQDVEKEKKKKVARKEFLKEALGNQLAVIGNLDNLNEQTATGDSADLIFTTQTQEEEAEAQVQNKYTYQEVEDVDEENAFLYINTTSDEEMREVLIRDKAEIEKRGKIWDMLFAEYMSEMAEKRKQKAEASKDKTRKPVKRKKKDTNITTNTAPSKSAAESAASLLRKRVRTIPGLDVDRLQNLFNASDGEELDETAENEKETSTRSKTPVEKPTITRATKKKKVIFEEDNATSNNMINLDFGSVGYGSFF